MSVPDLFLKDCLEAVTFHRASPDYPVILPVLVSVHLLVEYSPDLSAHLVDLTGAR